MKESIFFITGGAGCGKSYIVKEIAQSIQLYNTINITANTGKAAHLLNGVNIHAFAGIETGVKSLDYYKRHMHPDIKKAWLETNVLIIDEVSMINAQTFEILHLIACEIKQCYDELFGGIQVIACGDFFQLPHIKGEFVFKSKIWQQYMTQVLVLTECFRQKEDAQVFGALNEIRFGQVSDQTINYFKTHCFEKIENLNTKNTRLFFRNMEVDVYNYKKKESIKHEDSSSAVFLKIGAIVMLVRNINVEEGLSNGTIGTAILIENNAVWIIMNRKEVKIECVKEEILDCSHAVVGSRLGLRLKLAFSFTVCKAEGNIIWWQKFEYLPATNGLLSDYVRITSGKPVYELWYHCMLISFNKQFENKLSLSNFIQDGKKREKLLNKSNVFLNAFENYLVNDHDHFSGQVFGLAEIIATKIRRTLNIKPFLSIILFAQNNLIKSKNVQEEIKKIKEAYEGVQKLWNFLNLKTLKSLLHIYTVLDKVVLGSLMIAFDERTFEFTKFHILNHVSIFSYTSKLNSAISLIAA
ncbi:ATP-dependent DNA helicase PIF1-like [Hydra vulgaris]|uniref:ATP-dependent DNA helicase n=1 Tax=Hydra vulgaris TaxID=6087 RepID=A0ABM4BUH5_HYDVU